MKPVSIVFMIIFCLASIAGAGEKSVPAASAETKTEAGNNGLPQKETNAKRVGKIIEFSFGKNSTASAGSVVGEGSNRLEAGDITAVSIGVNTKAAAGSVIGGGSNHIDAGNMNAISGGESSTAAAGGVCIE